MARSRARLPSQNGEQTAAEALQCTNADASSFDPVSYTHLDVYKRQPLLAVERRVGREQAMLGAEERVPAARRRNLAVERGVGVEHLVVVDRRVLETCILGDGIALRRAEEDLPEAEGDLAGEIRDHAAHVMGDDLEIGQFIENARIDQPRHGRGGLVGPSEAEPDLGLGGLLAGVIRKVRAAHRMHEDRQVVLDHAAEDRPEFGQRERLARDIGEDLDAACAELIHGAIDLGERRVDIVQRQRRNEGREAVGMRVADLRQRIVREPRQCRGLIRPRNQLERRIGEREHLLEAVEAIEQRQTGVDIAERLEPRKRRHGDMAGNERRKALKIGLGHEMIEHIDHHRANPSTPYCVIMLAANSSSSFISRGVNPCSNEYCAIVSSTSRLATTPCLTMGVASALPASADTSPVSM